MVKRIMNKLFTDKLMSQYSFTGKKGKNKFSSLFVCAVIFGKLCITIYYNSNSLNTNTIVYVHAYTYLYIM